MKRITKYFLFAAALTGLQFALTACVADVGGGYNTGPWYHDGPWLDGGGWRGGSRGGHVGVDIHPPGGRR